MAYTAIAVTTVTQGGTRYDGQGTAGVAGGQGTGLSFPNNGRTVLLLENTAANTPVVNIETSGTTGGLAIADVAITMVANQDQVVGPFQKSIFDNSSGSVQINFTGSNETDVQILAIST